MTVDEAIRKTEEYKYGLKLGSVYEYKDRFVISYVGPEGEEIDVSPLYVLKADGTVGTFFPPNYSLEYLNTGKRIR